MRLRLFGPKPDDLPTAQIEVEVSEVVESFPLSPIVGVDLQVAEPGIAFLPMDELHHLYR